MPNPASDYRILICDPVGLRRTAEDSEGCAEVRAYVEAKGGVFHGEDVALDAISEDGRLHFFYRPNLSTSDDILAVAGKGQFDALIAAATFIPDAAQFRLGGVRMGAGTGNMGSLSWGGGSGAGGAAPLMNTPGFNSRATAHMVLKAMLKVTPDLELAALHNRVMAGTFDTGRDLAGLATDGFFGKCIAVLGYGNIGRRVARLAAAFEMEVRVFARARHRAQIEADGHIYCDTVVSAARNADFITPHLGVGARDTDTGLYANADMVGQAVFAVMRPGAVLINYDRGELVDVAALDAAMAEGRIRFASIDADIFVDTATGAVSGPLAPYRPVAERFGAALELLPHVAADTDHPTRVASARQAVDQMFCAVLEKRVFNLVGDLPEGYRDCGRVTPPEPRA